MVKLILGVVIILTTTVLGKKVTDKFHHKLKYYECLKRFNLYLKQNMLHKRDILVNLLDFKCENQDFSATLSSIKLKILQLSESCIYLPYWADEDDKTYLNEYFLSLGKNNSLAEIEFITAQEEIINEKVLKIADKNSKFLNLGQKLGLAVGIAVFIIIL